MNYKSGAVLIIIVCVMILCIISIRKKAEFILNFMLRSIVGVITIFMMNQILLTQNISLTVGINSWTVLTSGILGMPGVALLYGVSFLKFL